MIAAGAVHVMVGMTFTVTLTGADVVSWLAPSRARADSWWGPGGVPVASQLIAYGATVSSAPSGLPSSRNCTPRTPVSSAAFAETTMPAPETVAPLAGAVMATVGAKSLSTVTVTALAVAVPPLVSRATAVTKCVPFDTVAGIPGESSRG